MVHSNTTIDKPYHVVLMVTLYQIKHDRNKSQDDFLKPDEMLIEKQFNSSSTPIIFDSLGRKFYLQNLSEGTFSKLNASVGSLVRTFRGNLI